MEKGNIAKLIQVLENNKKNNVLLMGTSGSKFEDAIIIPATIPSEKLGIGIDDNGNYIYPSWVKELKEKKETKCMLIIDGLDKISTSDQDKFYGLLKYKKINGYTLPSNCQIVCTSKSKDKAKINERILGLNIIYIV